ncbi:MAG: F0F1 ATP synthase subunit alpha, partial [bacterium]
LAQFRELAAFAQFGSDLDARTKTQLDRGARIVELFKQHQFSPQPVELQVAILWAMQKGYFDPIAVDRVKDFQNQFSQFLLTRKEPVLASILRKGALDAEIEKELTAATDEFKVIFR